MSPIRNVVKYIILSLLVTVSTAAPRDKAHNLKKFGSSNLRNVVAQSTSSGTAATSGNASTDASGQNTLGQTGGGSSVGSSSQSATQAQGGPNPSGYAVGGSEAYGESSAEGNSDASGNGAHSTSDTNTQGTADTDSDSSVTINERSRENPIPAKLQQKGKGRDSSSTVCGNNLTGINGATPSSGASSGNALADAYASQGGIGETDAQTSTGSLSLPNGSVTCADAVAHGEGTDGSVVYTSSSSGSNADNV